MPNRTARHKHPRTPEPLNEAKRPRLSVKLFAKQLFVRYATLNVRTGTRVRRVCVRCGAVPAIGALEAGQCGKVRTDLWVTIGDAAAAVTSATVSAKMALIRLAAETTVFRHRVILAVVAIVLAAATDSVAAATVLAVAAIASAAAAEALGAQAVVEAPVARAVAVAAVSAACPRRSSVPAKAP